MENEIDSSPENIETMQITIDPRVEMRVIDSDGKKENPIKIETSRNTKKFNKIIRNYKSIQDNLNNTYDDILKLEKIHYRFVSNAENKIRFHEYGTYIDDIFYQLRLLKIEYHSQLEIQNHNIGKLYKDLFRLYSKIIKKLISIKIENNNLTAMMDKKQIDDKIQSDRKQYFQKVKPFNEIADNYINLEDCSILYNELETRLGDLLNAIQDILNSIGIAEEQKLDGLLLQTYLISLNSEKEKSIIEREVFEKLLRGILISHIDISKKYLERTIKISKEIINDTEKIKNI